MLVFEILLTMISKREKLKFLMVDKLESANVWPFALITPLSIIKMVVFFF